MSETFAGVRERPFERTEVDQRRPVEGEAELILLPDVTKILAAVWSLDGQRITTLGYDKIMRERPVTPSALRKALLEATDDCLLPELRRAYLDETDDVAWIGYDACEESRGRVPLPRIKAPH